LAKIDPPAAHLSAIAELLVHYCTFLKTGMIKFAPANINVMVTKRDREAHKLDISTICHLVPDDLHLNSQHAKTPV